MINPAPAIPLALASNLCPGRGGVFRIAVRTLPLIAISPVLASLVRAAPVPDGLPHFHPPWRSAVSFLASCVSSPELPRCKGGGFLGVAND